MKRIYVCDLAIKLSVFHPKTASRAALMESLSQDYPEFQIDGHYSN